MPELFSLQNKIAIVTGASKGIGKAIALSLAKQGATVVITGRKADALDQVVRELRAATCELHAFPCHMGDMDQISALAHHVKEQFGGVDIIVNNAATNPVFGPIAEADMKAFDKIMDVNVKGPIELARRVYPLMKARGGGSVINISSIEGLTPGHGLGMYSISKAALIAATKVLAREWGPDGIRVNAICPGLVKTKFSEALTSNEKIMKMVMARQALPMVAEPEDISGLAVYLASDASKFCTGAICTVDGGLTI